jgi:hypothetical protein
LQPLPLLQLIHRPHPRLRPLRQRQQAHQLQQ